jgi:hypothetical protein
VTKRLTNAQLDHVLKHCPWWPQEGPQTEAFDSKADVTLYGGQAGGGKTALAVGLACTTATETTFIRKESTQLGAVIDYMAETVGSRDGYSGHTNVFKLPAWDGRQRRVQFASCPNPGDEKKQMGRPKDHLIIDECANMRQDSVRFLMGWVRSTNPNQPCRTLLCSNPPTGQDGYWLTEMFEAWLDPNYHNPAQPGELRWYAMVAGKELAVDGPERFMHGTEEVIPQSRTFIPASLDDNKYLKDTGYRATLQSLPEPLRSQMLYGNWQSGRNDAEFCVIPSEWVELAMAKWQPRLFNPLKIVSAGLDPSRGGKDSTVLSCREDWYYHELQEWEGHEVKDGQTAAAKVIELLGMSQCPVHVDVIGIGSSVVDILGMYIHNRVVPVNVATRDKDETDWSGTLTFANKRAELWWHFRDILNPANGFDVQLPPDQKLKSELCAPTYQLKATGILIESKDEIKKRLGRSTDKADAVIMAAERTAILNMTGISGRVRVNTG